MCFIRIIFNKKKKLNEYLHDDSMFFMHDLFFVFKKYIKTIYTMLKKFYFNFQIYQYKSLSISVSESDKLKICLLNILHFEKKEE